MSFQLYRDVSSKVGKGVTINKSLCFYNPKEVYNGLHTKLIKNWHNFITKEYLPPKRDILLIYPCSTTKPYNESRSYRQLYHHLSKLNGKREDLHLMTISEPFGLVPEECYGKFNWYDCPGLFEWWCSKYGQDFDKDYLEKCLDILSDIIGIFLKKSIQKKRYKKIIGFVRTYTSKLDRKHDHTHRRMLEMAAEKYNLPIEILPDRNQVKNLIKRRGAFAWDMYGVAHPLLLKQLVRRLNS